MSFNGPTPVSDLFDRITRAAEREKGIRLELADLDLLVVTGVYEALCLEAVREMRELSKFRIAAREEAAIACEEELAQRPHAPTVKRQSRMPARFASTYGKGG